MDYTIAKIRDKIVLYEKYRKETYTNFLTPAEIQSVSDILKQQEYTIGGGYDEAERRIIVIGNNNADISQYLTIIRIESICEELNHRNVLGSVLGLGIKREMIGDIIVKNKICDIIIIRELKEYILNNLTKIGNVKVKTQEIRIGRNSFIRCKERRSNF